MCATGHSLYNIDRISPQRYKSEVTNRIRETPYTTHISNNAEAKIIRLLRLFGPLRMMPVNYRIGKLVTMPRLTIAPHPSSRAYKILPRRVHEIGLIATRCLFEADHAGSNSHSSQPDCRVRRLMCQGNIKDMSLTSLLSCS